MHQILIHGALTIMAVLLPCVQSLSLNVTDLAEQYPLQMQTVAAIPPKLIFSEDWDVVQEKDKIDKINAAYTEAFALAQYAIKDVVTKPLDIQNTPRLYFPAEFLKRYGLVENVLFLFALERGKEKYSYIFEKITVVKGTNHATCKLPRVPAFVLAGPGGTTDTILTVCEKSFFSNDWSTSLLMKPCDQLCDVHDDTWVALSTILLHELTHIQEVAIKGKPGTGGINDVKMDIYKKASPDCQKNGAYGWKCCQELKNCQDPKKIKEDITHRNADNYMWMVIEQVVDGKCFKGRKKEACKQPTI